MDRLASDLRSWGAAKGRKLPWRRRRDAYALLVAEVLLQQTTAASVVPVWVDFIDRYPGPGDLLAAPDSDLLTLVHRLGLGHQRIRRLRESATALVAGSHVYPGLGPYGHAVLMMAQGKSRTSTPVDANVARVVCRVADLHWERGEPRRKREVREFVDLLLGNDSPEAQILTLYALLDVAATVCRVRTTSCWACPVVSQCASAAPEPSTSMTALPSVSASGGGTQSETSRI